MTNCIQGTKKTTTCPCTYECDKHGKCCECIAYHRKRKELPACYFTSEQERMYDRSIDYYNKCNRFTN